MDKMKISEKQLEDWICEHPDELFLDLEIIGRQIPLEHGRLDLLGYETEHIWVIELKARPIKEEDVAQVLRYTHDVAMVLKGAGHRMTESGELPLNHLGPVKRDMFYDFWYRRLEIHAVDGLWNRGDSIKPVLIGTSADERIAIAAQQANADIYLWRYADETQEFIFDLGPFPWSSGHTEIPTWAETLSRRIYSECMELTESYYDFEMDRLFGIKQ